MKHLLLQFVIILCTVVTILSCAKHEKSSIENVALKYLKAMNEDNFKEACNYADDESKKLITLLEKIHTENLSMEVNYNVNLTIVDIVMLNDTTAEVRYKETYGNNSIQYEVLPMKKVDNKWLVHKIVDIDSLVFDSDHASCMKK